MRKLIISLHTTLDGFVAGPNGEINWVHLDEEMFDLVGKFTNDADTALYGRVTWEMMDSYWPTAADNPKATKHDIEHSTWYKKVHKVVISGTKQDVKKEKTSFIGSNIPGEILKLKNQAGKNIMIFGSPSTAAILLENNLIDEFWLFVNPVFLGRGIRLFDGLKNKVNLKFVTSQIFSSGVTGNHYVLDKK